MKLSSPSFVQGGVIPEKLTCKGDDVNPELLIKEVPEGAKTLALIMDDPDAPVGTWDHWVVWNIPVTSKISENSVPGIQGLNSWGRNDYGGPCPPSGVHRYFFKLYALDTKLDLSPATRSQDLMSAIEDHVLASAELMGRFSK